MPLKNSGFFDRVDPLLSCGSVAVPNVVLLSPKLRADEKILYALMLDHAQNQTASLTVTSLQEERNTTTYVESGSTMAFQALWCPRFI